MPICKVPLLLLEVVVCYDRCAHCVCLKEKGRWEPPAGQRHDCNLRLRTGDLAKESEEEVWGVG